MGLDVGGVQEHVGKADVVQAPFAKFAHRGVELGADAAHLALGRPRVDAQRRHQVVDLARRYPVHEGLHDHRPQGPVDATAGLEQRRVEAAVAQLGDGELDIARLGGQQTIAVAVAMGGTGLGALVAGGADHLGCLQFDQRLQHQLHRPAHEVQIAARAQCVEQFGQGRLVKGHRCDLLREPG